MAGHEREAVQVYWRPGCAACRSLRVALAEAGVAAKWHNIWEQPEARAFVRSVANGNETVPTVVVAGEAYVAPSARGALDVISQAAPSMPVRARRWPLLRIIQWIAVTTLIVAGLALASAGEGGWSYAASAGALITYWSLRRLRGRTTLHT